MLGGAGDPAPDARGDRRSVAHRPDPAPPARAARRGARRPGAVRPDDLHDAPGGLSRDGSHDRRRRLRCATAVVRAVPPLGHVGRRRSGREPAGDGGGDACRDGDPIRPRVARVGGGVPPDRANAVGLGTRRAAEPRAPPCSGARRRCAAGRRPRAGTNPVRRAASAQARALRAPAGRDPHRGQGRYDGPAAFLERPGRVAALARRGRGSAPGVGRAPTSALAGRDVRLPPGVHGGPAALERAGCGARGARVLAIDPAFGGDARGDRHVPRDRRHPVATGRGGMRARGRELHPFGGRSRRRVVARPHRRSGSASRCHTGGAARIPGGAHHRGGDPGRLAVDARGAPRREATRRRDGGDGRVLRLREGSRGCWPRTSSSTRATSDERLGPRPRRATDDLPRTRRRARARRWSREPGDRGAAAGVGRGPVQGDRAGRGGVRALRERRARAAASGAGHERGRAGERARVATRIRRTRSGARSRRCPTRHACTTRSWCGPRGSWSSSDG